MIYLITFACYGAHLHGHETGSVDRHHNRYGSPGVARGPSTRLAGTLRDESDAISPRRWQSRNSLSHSL